MDQCPVLYVIVPCYNEEKVLPFTCVQFLDKIEELSAKGQISADSRILFVDDGSKDETWEIICGLARRDKHYIGIAQSRNRGHQSALLAGLEEARNYGCDITISIDCDGQDDINAMNVMVEEFWKGCEIVYGVRSNRDADSWLKRFTAERFYLLMNWMGAETVFNHADYRLLSRRILDELHNFQEVNIFLRGMVPLVGFKSTSVYYERHERLAGKSSYTLKRMVTLAFDGISSFSTKPLHMITALGLTMAVLSFAGVVWSIMMHFVGHTVSGWASITSIICFIGGIQLVCLGVMGEYVGKIYLEVKRRPRYIISKRTDDDSSGGPERHSE